MTPIKWNNILGFNDNDQYHLFLPLHHIGGLAIILRAIHLGFSVNINAGKLNISYESSIISLVPTLLISLMALVGDLIESMMKRDAKLK